MILIGMNEEQKQEQIKQYIEKHQEIKKVIVFSPKKFTLKLPTLSVSIKQLDWDDIIRWRIFYPLLEEIDKSYLIIVNELMRNNKRNNLTYNCLRHYLNQCGHQIVFEYFPLIDDRNDFMILYDFDTKSKYRNQNISDNLLREHSSKITIYQHNIDINTQLIDLPKDATHKYENKKDELFKKLGNNKDPNNIPRALELYCGTWKKRYIENNKCYIARNDRFKRSNVIVYKNASYKQNYILLDFMHKRIDMNDFFRKTQQNKYIFISTGLSIDNVYIEQFKEWREKYNEFIKKSEEAGICIR